MKRRFLTLVVFGLCWLCHYASAQADALYPIWENGLYGYMDASGSPAIAAQWESVSSFVHGYALVRDGMEYAVVDQEGRIRLDDWELREDVQKEVMEIWDKIRTENITELADVEGYWDDFYRMFGFRFPNVDYTQDVEI